MASSTCSHFLPPEIFSLLCLSLPLFFFLSDEDGSGGQESGIGCDSPSCEADGDIYFSIPPTPINPRVFKVVHQETTGGDRMAHGSMALALCGLTLALLAPHWR